MSSPVMRALALVALAAQRVVVGDLGAALRRAGGSSPASATLPAAAALDGPVVVPLRRVTARSGPEADQDTSFYVGSVWVGEPAQELQVLFDTASGNALLPHRACERPACVEHTRYSPWASSSAMDVNVDGGLVQAGRRYARGKGMRDGVTLSYTQADLGEGDAKAVLVRDRVCIGATGGAGACVDMGLLAATSLADQPFLRMPNDGVIGLGMQGLAAGPMTNFLARAFQGARHAQPVFSIALGPDAGELRLGGVDDARIAGPLQWTPVDKPEQGFWQVAISAVRIGNVTVDKCSHGCHGVVDSGASRLGAQAGHDTQLRVALAPQRGPGGRCVGPELVIELTHGPSLTLTVDEYADKACNQALIGRLDLNEPEFVGVYALGANVLRRYYAAFDSQNLRIGFARYATVPSADSDNNDDEGDDDAEAPAPREFVVF